MNSLRTRIGQWLHRLRSGSVEFNMRPYQKQLQQINAFDSQFRDCRDDQLQAAARRLREQVAAGTPRAAVLAEAFALVREAAKRLLGMRPYDEQMLAALVLDQGKVTWGRPVGVPLVRDSLRRTVLDCFSCLAACGAMASYQKLVDCSSLEWMSRNRDREEERTMNRLGYFVQIVTVWLTCAAATLLAVDQGPSQQFRNWDKNGDGKLTRNELPAGVRSNFDRVDANSDGVITPDEDNAFRSRNDANRQAKRSTRSAPRMPDTIRVTRDIAYAGTDNARQTLDVYLPTKPTSDKPLPVVVWIHGGAWRGGDKASGFGQLRKFVSSGGYAGISVGYRLTGEASWPAQIHDCKAAIRWIRGNAKQYNLDPERIGVWGSSAGGHLVAMLGTAGDVESLEGDLGKYRDQSSRVTCVVDYFGPSELLTMGDAPSAMDHNAPQSPESKLVGGTLQETKTVAQNASPVTHVSKDDPPFLVVHGDKDMTVPHNQSVRLEARLRDVGADVTFITIAGGGHGGFGNEELTRRVDAFFAKHLRGQDGKIEGGTIVK